MQQDTTGGSDLTVQTFLQHPGPHSVPWRDVLAMFRHLPDTTVVEEHNGHLKVRRHDKALVLHRPHGKDLADKDDLARIREFIEHSGAPAAATPGVGTHLLVVIDHREARVFSAEMHGAAPQRLTPYDPFGFGRSLHFVHTGGDDSPRPERKSFYEAVAATLGGARQILLFGTATGSSSAMDHLRGHLEKHHRDIADRIIGSVVVDEHHLTDDQLLAKAHGLFAAAG